MNPEYALIEKEEHRSWLRRIVKRLLGAKNVAHTGVLTHRTGSSMAACPSKYLAFRSVGVIAAGAPATIVQQPQERFKVFRVMVPSSIGLAFTIDDISIGTESQNVDPQVGFLAQLASETNGGLEVCFKEVCEPGIQARMQVTNITGVPQTFFALWTGESLKVC